MGVLDYRKIERLDVMMSDCKELISLFKGSQEGKDAEKAVGYIGALKSVLLLVSQLTDQLMDSSAMDYVEHVIKEIGEKHELQHGTTDGDKVS